MFERICSNHRRLGYLVEDTPSNIRRLLSCLVQFGQGFPAELEQEDFTDEEGAIRVQEDFDLDIFVRMRGSFKL